jgi:hypothetical protein
MAAPMTVAARKQLRIIEYLPGVLIPKAGYQVPL